MTTSLYALTLLFFITFQSTHICLSFYSALCLYQCLFPHSPTYFPPSPDAHTQTLFSLTHNDLLSVSCAWQHDNDTVLHYVSTLLWEHSVRRLFSDEMLVVQYYREKKQIPHINSERNVKALI